MDFRWPKACDPPFLGFAGLNLRINPGRRVARCPRICGRLARRLGGAAEVVAILAGPAVGDTLPGLAWILAELATRGISRLLVEGGASVLAQFVSAGLADEFRLGVAPVFVADPRATRLLRGPVGLPRLVLAETRQVGDMAVLKYLLSAKSGG